MAIDELLNIKVKLQEAYADDLQKMESSFIKSSVAIAGAFTAASAVVAKLVLDTAKVGDQFQKMSIRTGVSSKTLSEFAHVAELCGTNIETVETALIKMEKVSKDSSIGLKTATDTFDQLGIKATDVIGKVKPTEQLFLEVIDALRGIDNQGQRAALAQEIFGKSGTKLLTIVNESKDSVAALRQEADDLGITFDKVAADNAAKFNDELDRAKKQATGLGYVIGNTLIPPLTALLEIINSKAKDTYAGKSTVEALLPVYQQLYTDSLEWSHKYSQSSISTITSEQELINFLELEKKHLTEIEKGLSSIANPGGSGAFAFIRLQEQKKQSIQLIKSFQEQLDKLRAPKPVETPQEQPASKIGVLSPKEAADLMSFNAEINQQLQDEESRNANINEELRQRAIDREIAQYEKAFQEQWRLEVQKNERIGEAAISHNTYMEEIRKKDLAAAKRNEQLKIQTAQLGASNVTATLENLNTLAKSKHRSYFEFLKLARMSEAIINTYAGASRALAEYPWPYSLIVAGGVVLAGLSQVAVISSQQFEGGSSSASSSSTNTSGSSPTTELTSTTATTAGTPTSQQATQQWTVIIQNPIGNEDWDQIAEDNIIPAMRRAANRNITVS